MSAPHCEPHCTSIACGTDGGTAWCLCSISGDCATGGASGGSRSGGAALPVEWHPGLHCSCGEKVMPCGLTASELEALVVDDLFGKEADGRPPQPPPSPLARPPDILLERAAVLMALRAPGSLGDTAPGPATPINYERLAAPLHQSASAPDHLAAASRAEQGGGRSIGNSRLGAGRSSSGGDSGLGCPGDRAAAVAAAVPAGTSAAATVGCSSASTCARFQSVNRVAAVAGQEFVTRRSGPRERRCSLEQLRRQLCQQQWERQVQEEWTAGPGAGVGAPWGNGPAAPTAAALELQAATRAVQPTSLAEPQMEPAEMQEQQQLARCKSNSWQEWSPSPHTALAGSNAAHRLAAASAPSLLAEAAEAAAAVAADGSSEGPQCVGGYAAEEVRSSVAAWLEASVAAIWGQPKPMGDASSAHPPSQPQVHMLAPTTPGGTAVPVAAAAAAPAAIAAPAAAASDKLAASGVATQCQYSEAAVCRAGSQCGFNISQGVSGNGGSSSGKQARRSRWASFNPIAALARLLRF